MEEIKLAIELNRDNYESETKNVKELVLVDFWGPQCHPCLKLMPVVEELEKTYKGRLKVTKVNSTQNRMLCAKLRVMGLPTFILYKDGTEVKRLTGESITRNDLVSEIEAILVK
jgi:thioredoxin 1